jgi:putative transcriptional regulator
MFEELKQGLQEMKAERQGKITLKTTEVEMPAPIKMPKTRIAAIRKSHNLSQPVFARMLATNVATLRNWEQGRSEPNAQAKLLLKMVETDGAVLERMVELTAGKTVKKTPAKKGVPATKANIRQTAKRKRSEEAA